MLILNSSIVTTSLVEDVGNGRDYACVGAGGVREILYVLLSFAVNLKRALVSISTACDTLMGLGKGQKHFKERDEGNGSVLG